MMEKGVGRKEAEMIAGNIPDEVANELLVADISQMEKIPVRQIGYVKEYSIHLERNPIGTVNGESEVEQAASQVYFKVKIENSEEELQEYKLLRKEISEEVDKNQHNFGPQGNSTPAKSAFWAITWAHASMILIATIKEAFIGEYKVEVFGQRKNHVFMKEEMTEVTKPMSGEKLLRSVYRKEVEGPEYLELTGVRILNEKREK